MTAKSPAIVSNSRKPLQPADVEHYDTKRAHLEMERRRSGVGHDTLRRLDGTEVSDIRYSRLSWPSQVGMNNVPTAKLIPALMMTAGASWRKTSRRSGTIQANLTGLQQSMTTLLD